MRRIALVLVCLGVYLTASQQSAQAHGICHKQHHHAPHVAYAPWTAGYSVPYAVPYYGNTYGYPPTGFSVAGRNFSLWFGR